MNVGHVSKQWRKRVNHAHEQTGVMDIKFHPLGHILVTSGFDGNVKFWTRPRPGEQCGENGLVPEMVLPPTGDSEWQRSTCRYTHVNFRENPFADVVTDIEVGKNKVLDLTKKVEKGDEEDPGRLTPRGSDSGEGGSGSGSKNSNEDEDDMLPKVGTSGVDLSAFQLGLGQLIGRKMKAKRAAKLQAASVPKAAPGSVRK